MKFSALLVLLLLSPASAFASGKLISSLPHEAFEKNKGLSVSGLTVLGASPDKMLREACIKKSNMGASRVRAGSDTSERDRPSRVKPTDHLVLPSIKPIKITPLVKVSWRVLQNKAARNADSGPEATVEALQEHLASLPKKRVCDYITAIAANSTQLRDEPAKLTAELGADVVNRDLSEQALATYAEVMPLTLRGLRPDALLGELSRGCPRFDPDAFARSCERVIGSVPTPEAPDEVSPLSLVSY